jgi:hypothetical protein
MRAARRESREAGNPKATRVDTYALSRRSRLRHGDVPEGSASASLAEPAPPNTVRNPSAPEFLGAELGPSDHDAQGGVVASFQLAAVIGGYSGQEHQGE